MYQNARFHSLRPPGPGVRPLYSQRSTSAMPMPTVMVKEMSSTRSVINGVPIEDQKQMLHWGSRYGGVEIKRDNLTQEEEIRQLPPSTNLLRSESVDLLSMIRGESDLSTPSPFHRSYAPHNFNIYTLSTPIH